jgi:hypothetical protein
MSRYRKIPVVIEAFEWKGSFEESFADDNILCPKWIIHSITSAEAFIDDDCLMIKTLEGVMKANVGDYIIQGVNGEIYPCKPDIFKKTYEFVEETQ